MAAAVADCRNPLAAADHVAHLPVEGFVIAVEAHITIAVVDDEKIPETAQPVGENHPPARDGAYFLPGPRGDEKPLPDDAATLPWTAEAVRKFPPDRQP